MVNRNKKNTNENKSLLRILTSVYIVFIGSFIYLLWEMAKMGYEILFYVFNITFFYLPIFYAGWIVKFAYDNMIFISKPSVRKALWGTILVNILLILSHIGEFYPIVSGTILTRSQLIKEYIDNAFLHQVSFLSLIILLTYIRMIILKKKMPFVFLLNSFFSLVLIYFISRHLYSFLNYLLRIAGIINEEGINAVSLCIILLVIISLLIGKFLKFLPQIRKKKRVKNDKPTKPRKKFDK